MTIYTFSGTPGAAYSPPVGQANYGDIFKYGADGTSLRGDGAGSYAQLVITTVISGVWRTVVLFDRLVAGTGDSIAAIAINSSRTGFAIEIGSAGGGTVYCNKQVTGSNAGAIIAPTAGIGEPLGINSIDVTWDLSTGAFNALYNGVSVASSTYNDVVTNMYGGAALYKDASSNNITIKQIEVGLASSTTIDLISTGGNPELKVGEVFDIDTTGLSDLTAISIQTVATPAAITSAVSITAPAGDGIASMPAWADAAYYPFSGTVKVTATDGTDTAETTTTLVIPDNQTSVVFNSVETSNNTYIGNKMLAIGKPLANGDIGYYPPAGPLVIGTNSSVSSAIGATTFVLWIHKVSGIMERYDVVINDAGEITDVTGITSRGITSRAVTSRVVTSRGI